MKEYSSTIEEIEERLETINYKLALIKYIIDEINSGNIGQSKTNKVTDQKNENNEKQDIEFFNKQIRKLLRTGGNELNSANNNELIIGNTLEENPRTECLKEYLPILNKIKIAKEGEIILLERRKKEYYNYEQ